jgi:hypothetical protein
MQVYKAWIVHLQQEIKSSAIKSVWLTTKKSPGFIY